MPRKQKYPPYEIREVFPKYESEEERIEKLTELAMELALIGQRREREKRGESFTA